MLLTGAIAPYAVRQIGGSSAEPGSSAAPRTSGAPASWRRRDCRNRA